MNINMSLKNNIIYKYGCKCYFKKKDKIKNKGIVIKIVPCTFESI